MARLDAARSIPRLIPAHAEFEPDYGPFRCVALQLLLPGTTVTLNTRNSFYRLTVVNGAEGRVRITGGRLFEEPTEAEVVGAVEDEEDTRPGWVVEGLRLKLQTHDGPVLTSIVESVDVE